LWNFMTGCVLRWALFFFVFSHNLSNRKKETCLHHINEEIIYKMLSLLRLVKFHGGLHKFCLQANTFYWKNSQNPGFNLQVYCKDWLHKKQIISFSGWWIWNTWNTNCTTINPDLKWKEQINSKQHILNNELTYL
jgi:hypothetical protein